MPVRYHHEFGTFSIAPSHACGGNDGVGSRAAVAGRYLSSDGGHDHVRACPWIDSYDDPVTRPIRQLLFGFDNIGEGLVLSPPLMEKYFEIAGQAADLLIPSAKGAVSIESETVEIGPDSFTMNFEGSQLQDQTMRLVSQNTVVIRSYTWPTRFEATYTGTYSIKARMSAFNPKSDEPLQVELLIVKPSVTFSQIAGIPRAATFQVPADGRTHELSAEFDLEKGQTVAFYWANAPIGGDADHDIRETFLRIPRLHAAWKKIGGFDRRRTPKQTWKALKLSMANDELDLSAPEIKDPPKKYRVLDRNGMNSVIQVMHMEQGPALDIHGAEFNGPTELKESREDRLQRQRTAKFLDSFVGQWLDLDVLPDIMPDERLLKWTPKHQAAITDETRMFVAEILRENHPLETFIDPDFTYLNRRNADLYGTKVQGDEMQRVTLERGGRYGGILGQASVMMATANGVDTQPVLRGVWLLENIFGHSALEPPTSVPAIEPDTSGATTIQELLDRHKADASCASCHKKIDPLGFALENFDPVGRWREFYPVYEKGPDTRKSQTFITKKGQPVDTKGQLTDGTPLGGVVDLKRYLVKNIDTFSACLTGKLLTYATGRSPSFGDRKEIQRVVREVKEKGNGFQDLIVGVVLSESFRRK